MTYKLGNTKLWISQHACDAQILLDVCRDRSYFCLYIPHCCSRGTKYWCPWTFIGILRAGSSFLKIEVTMPDTPAYESVWMCEYLVEKRKVKQCKEQMKLKKNNLNISATLPVSVFDTSTVSVQFTAV